MLVDSAHDSRTVGKSNSAFSKIIGQYSTPVRKCNHVCKQSRGQKNCMEI